MLLIACGCSSPANGLDAVAFESLEVGYRANLAVCPAYPLPSPLTRSLVPRPDPTLTQRSHALVFSVNTTPVFLRILYLPSSHRIQIYVKSGHEQRQFVPLHHDAFEPLLP